MARSIEGKHPEYYEAILQLRDCAAEVEGLVISEIAKANIPVAKKVKVKRGVDYYLADNNFTRALGKKLRERFGGEVKITASLWGRKKGKEVYRVTVLFRCFGLVKGDRVVYGGEEWVVKLRLENEVMLQKVKSGEKIHVRYGEMEKIKKK